MINHLMLIQGIAFNEKTCMINIYFKMFKIMQENLNNNFIHGERTIFVTKFFVQTFQHLQCTQLLCNNLLVC